jgi:hypothetical protein
MLIESAMPTFDTVIAEDVTADPIDHLSRRPHPGLAHRADAAVGGVDVDPRLARAVVR